MDSIILILDRHRGSALVVGDGPVRSMDTEALQKYLGELLAKRAKDQVSEGRRKIS
jgi:hypothetical protein